MYIALDLLYINYISIILSFLKGIIMRAKKKITKEMTFETHMTLRVHFHNI